MSTISTEAVKLPAPDLSDEDVVGRGRLAVTTLAQYRTEAERLFWYARQTGVPISIWER